MRYAGLDVTVYESNSKRAPGHLSRQGPALLRWALFEAAQCAARKSSPDYGYYLKVRERIDHPRACLSVARKLARRAHHILRGWATKPSHRSPTRLPSPRDLASALPLEMDIVCATPSISLMICGRLPQCPCRHDAALDDLERMSGRKLARGFTPSTIMSPDQKSVHLDKAGRPRARTHLNYVRRSGAMPVT